MTLDSFPIEDRFGIDYLVGIDQLGEDMENGHGRRSILGAFSSLPTRISGCSVNPQMEHNFQEFVYRDMITRKQYVFGTLKEKKVKLTVSRRKHNRVDTKPALGDQEGHLRILSNIKQYRFNELLNESKLLKRLGERMVDVESSKIKNDQQGVLKIRSNLMRTFSKYNLECFRKYMINNGTFDPKLGLMKNLESNRLTKDDLRKLLAQFSQEQKSSDQPPQEGEKQNVQVKKVVDQQLSKQIEDQFQSKYRKQYQSLEADIKYKINNQVRCLIEPDAFNYRSVKPAIKKPLKALLGRHDQFQSHVDDVREKTLNMADKLLSAKTIKTQNQTPDSSINLQYLRHLITIDNTFDLKCELNEHPELIQLIDRKGNTLLHHAIKESRYQVCRILIAKNIDTNRKNNLGYTPIKVAEHFNQREIRQLILNHNNKARDKVL